MLASFARAINPCVVGFGPMLFAQPNVRGVPLGNPPAGKTVAVILGASQAQPSILAIRRRTPGSTRGHRASCSSPASGRWREAPWLSPRRVSPPDGSSGMNAVALPPMTGCQPPALGRGRHKLRQRCRRARASPFAFPHSSMLLARQPHGLPYVSATTLALGAHNPPLTQSALSTDRARNGAAPGIAAKFGKNTE
jgi:hypothetical protein